MTGLTRLLEGQKEAASAASGRKENRRETWCPGAKGACQLTSLTVPTVVSVLKPYIDNLRSWNSR